jgi:hypothetical protein
VGTASVGGEVEPVHELEPFGVEEADPGPERVEEPDEAVEKRSGVPSIWTILIILFVIITIARNFIEGQ